MARGGLEKTVNTSAGKGIYIRRPMLVPQADSIRDLVFPASAGSAEPTPIECEIVDLFTQLRSPLLRYVMAIGLSVHDGEEIIQEVFLALFHHLQLRRSRRNLRGWIFRVAHNLALKQRFANKRAEATLH